MDRVADGGVSVGKVEGVEADSEGDEEDDEVMGR
jgi:hypothetical protein